mmetsp:Transcript_16145/g.28707  ORF Transcript_16145/g.28707 Transcript_16145/m.28707 type:complete len:443 (-) Transcript_16145:846-2174(-)
MRATISLALGRLTGSAAVQSSTRLDSSSITRRAGPVRLGSTLTAGSRISSGCMIHPIWISNAAIPAKGRLRVRISHSVTPNEYTSALSIVAPPTSLSSGVLPSSSGAEYSEVPTTPDVKVRFIEARLVSWPAPELLFASTSRLIPKSPIFITRPWLTKMLPGLMSRWRMGLERRWRWRMPRAMLRTIGKTTFMGSQPGPPPFPFAPPIVWCTIVSNVPRGQYSITISSSPSCSATARAETMLSCEPASTCMTTSCTLVVFFTATGDSLYHAAYTAPSAPAPKNFPNLSSSKSTSSIRPDRPSCSATGTPGCRSWMCLGKMPRVPVPMLVRVLGAVVEAVVPSAPSLAAEVERRKVPPPPAPTAPSLAAAAAAAASRLMSSLLSNTACNSCALGSVEARCASLAGLEEGEPVPQVASRMGTRLGAVSELSRLPSLPPPLCASA